MSLLGQLSNVGFSIPVLSPADDENELVKLKQDLTTVKKKSEFEVIYFLNILSTEWKFQFLSEVFLTRSL